MEETNLKNNVFWWTNLSEARAYLDSAEDFMKAKQYVSAKREIYEAYRILDIAFLDDQQTREVEFDA